MSDTDLESFPDDFDRALVIVAHPDDIEWGTSAAVARWTATGKTVSYLLVTRGEAGIDTLAPAECATVREAEQRAAGAAVGVREITFLDNRDGVIEEGVTLRRELAAAIRAARPELVVTLNPYERWGSGPGAPWNSADHRAVGRSTLDAVADAGNRWIFPQLTDRGLDAWPGIRWIAISGSPHPTHVLDTAAYAERAVDSLAAHARYLGALHPGQDPADAARAILGDGSSVAFEVIGV